MPDFALYHKADWRDGETPKTEGATLVVYQDTRHRAYDVHAHDEGEFLEWVAAMFSGDNDPMYGVDFEGSVHEYLDEIDVSVRDAEWFVQ
jgi:hypothetical protein